MYADRFQEDKVMLKSPSGTSNTSPFLWNNWTFEERFQINHLDGCTNSSDAGIGTEKKSSLCFVYKHYSNPQCLIQSGDLFKCKFGKLHECSVCCHFGCVSYQHHFDAQLHLLSTPDMSEIYHQITSTTNEGFDKLTT